MLTWGRAMSGYWATGRLKIDSTPAIMMTMATTQAKIGRSIKKRDSMGPVLIAPRRWKIRQIRKP